LKLEVPTDLKQLARQAKGVVAVDLSNEMIAAVAKNRKRAGASSRQVYDRGTDYRHLIPDSATR
jgi:hypothetical protein